MSLPKALKNHGTVQLLVLATVFFYAFVFFVRDVNAVRLLRLSAIDGLYHDRYRAVHGRGGHETSVVIVSIDDESLQKLAERWPWRRTLMAELLTKVTAAGARLVAFDLSFTVPSERASDDAAFADAVRKSGKTVLSGYFGAGDASVEPLPLLADAAQEIGFLNTPRDPDNSNRRTWPSLISAEGQERASFSAAIAGRAMGTPSVELAAARRAASGAAGAPGREGEDPGVWTPYDYALEDFEVVPFWKIIRDQAPRSFIKDRIVIVGATGEIFHDMYRTPLGVMPGVALHANQVMNYLKGNAVRPAPDRTFYTALLALTLMLTLVFSKLRLGRGLLLLALAMLGVREAAIRLFLNGVRDRHDVPFRVAPDREPGAPLPDAPRRPHRSLYLPLHGIPAEGGVR